MSLHVPSALSSDPLIGQQINNLRIVERIGRGGFGAVYRAEHQTLGTSFAVKVLHLDMQMRPEVVARFQREARAIAMLDHINVVRVSDFGQFGSGSYYLAMDYLEGQSLAEALMSGVRFSAQEVGAIMHQICVALGYIHQKGIVHRDLKPGNLFLCHVPGRSERLVKLLDFGIASLQSDQSLTQSGAALGSPVYMSPEQAMGRMRDVDGRTDVYSLGVLLYHLLTGVPPFLGDGFGVFVVKHLYHEPPPLEQTAPHVLWTSPLEILLQKMLAKQRDERPGDMLWLAHNMRAVMEEQSLFAPQQTYPAFTVDEVQSWSEVSSTGGKGGFPTLFSGKPKNPLLSLPLAEPASDLSGVLPTQVTPHPRPMGENVLPSVKELSPEDSCAWSANALDDSGFSAREKVEQERANARSPDWSGVEEHAPLRRLTSPLSLLSNLWVWVCVVAFGVGVMLVILWWGLFWEGRERSKESENPLVRWVGPTTNSKPASRSAARRKSRWKGRPTVGRWAKPGSQGARRSVSKAAERSVSKAAERSVSKAAESSVSKAAERSVSKAAERSVSTIKYRPPVRVRIVLQSRPRRARVYRGRRYLGRTPVVLRGRPKRSVVVRLRAKGYFTLYRRLYFPGRAQRRYFLRLRKLRKKATQRHRSRRRDSPGGIIGINPFE